MCVCVWSEFRSETEETGDIFVVCKVRIHAPPLTQLPFLSGCLCVCVCVCVWSEFRSEVEETVDVCVVCEVPAQKEEIMEHRPGNTT